MRYPNPVVIKHLFKHKVYFAVVHLQESAHQSYREVMVSILTISEAEKQLHFVMKPTIVDKVPLLSLSVDWSWFEFADGSFNYKVAAEHANIGKRSKKSTFEQSYEDFGDEVAVSFDLESGEREVIDDSDAIMGQDDLDVYEFVALKHDSSGKAIEMHSLDKKVPRDDDFLQEIKEAL